MQVLLFPMQLTPDCCTLRPALILIISSAHILFVCSPCIATWASDITVKPLKSTGNGKYIRLQELGVVTLTARCRPRSRTWRKE